MLDGTVSLKIPVFERGSKIDDQDNTTEKPVNPKQRVDSAALHCTGVNALHIPLRRTVSVGSWVCTRAASQNQQCVCLRLYCHRCEAEAVGHRSIPSANASTWWLAEVTEGDTVEDCQLQSGTFKKRWNFFS